MRASKLIFSTLKQIAEVQETRSRGTTTARIYPLRAVEHAEDNPPYLIYNDSISNDPELTLEEFTGHENVRIQIDVYAKGYTACEELAIKVMWALDALPDTEYIGNQSMPNPDNTLSRRTVEFYMWQSYCD